MLRRLPLLLALMFAAPAFAQDEEDDGPTSMDGVGRITVQGGWRSTSNETFYKGWYGRTGNGDLARARKTGGGPFGVASFAYSLSDLVELGIDLFATGSRLYVTEPGVESLPPTERGIDTLAYGAMLGLRFQKLLPEVGPYGLVPFLGFLTGPTLISSERDGEAVRERTTQAWAGSLGATWRLSSRWGITGEYRFMFLRGPVGPEDAKIGSFSLGGSWLSLGVTYTFPPEPSRGLPGSGL
ncbi:outer membrane beta-barrel protein [Myxococcus sp. CA040A]|uniref:outer membrane beta-barrel protein n=1 Tax=Myxococcus sp. CA040A TaxID=2741738 RepID=UPI00157B1A83|nr:outer membrane beta-barrel protein [Myxococcus sp. CA040A]NTX02327.1 outer membrane beta-barrel protein [Myxococcus sp. CA040A]